MSGSRSNGFIPLAASSLGVVGLLSLAGVVSAFRAHSRALLPAEPTASASASAPKLLATTPPIVPSSAEPATPPPDPCRQAFDAGKLDEALKTCQKALDSTDDSAERSSFYTTLGLIEEKRGQKKEAERDLLNALLYGFSDDAASALGRVGKWEAKARTGTATISMHGSSKSALVRKEPKANGARVAKIATGTEVHTFSTVTSGSKAWSSVELDGKKHGWISDSVLSGGEDQ